MTRTETAIFGLVLLALTGLVGAAVLVAQSQTHEHRRAQGRKRNRRPELEPGPAERLAVTDEVKGPIPVLASA